MIVILSRLVRRCQSTRYCETLEDSVEIILSTFSSRNPSRNVSRQVSRVNSFRDLFEDLTAPTVSEVARSSGNDECLDDYMMGEFYDDPIVKVDPINQSNHSANDSYYPSTPPGTPNSIGTPRSRSRSFMLVEDNDETQDTPRSSHALNMDELRDALSDLPGVGIMSRCLVRNSSGSGGGGGKGGGGGGLGQKKRSSSLSSSSLSTSSSRDLQGLLLQHQTESEGGKDKKDNWNGASGDGATPATTSNLFGTYNSVGGGNDNDGNDGGVGEDGNDGSDIHNNTPSGDFHIITQKSITNMKLKDKVTKRISAKDQLAIDKLHQAAGKHLKLLIEFKSYV